MRRRPIPAALGWGGTLARPAPLVAELRLRVRCRQNPDGSVDIPFYQWGGTWHITYDYPDRGDGVWATPIFWGPHGL